MAAPHALGCRPSTPDIRDFTLADHISLPDAASLPPLIDLRNELPEAYDQGQEGSCTGAAAAAVYRHARRKRHGWPLPATWQPSLHYGALEDYDPSIAQIYWCTRKLEGSEQYDSGASIRDAIKSLNAYGAAAWHNMPYVAGDYAQVPSPTVLTNATHHETAHYYALDGGLEQYHQALAMRFLPMIGIAVYESFHGAGVTGRIPMPQKTERMIGGHAQVLVGIDVPNQEFISRNSWGQWGDQGYLHFPFAYILDPQLTFDPWIVDLGAL